MKINLWCDILKIPITSIILEVDYKSIFLSNNKNVIVEVSNLFSNSDTRIERNIKKK